MDVTTPVFTIYRQKNGRYGLGTWRSERKRSSLFLETCHVSSWLLHVEYVGSPGTFSPRIFEKKTESNVFSCTSSSSRIRNTAF